MIEDLTKKEKRKLRSDLIVMLQKLDKEIEDNKK